MSDSKRPIYDIPLAVHYVFDLEELFPEDEQFTSAHAKELIYKYIMDNRDSMIQKFPNLQNLFNICDDKKIKSKIKDGVSRLIKLHLNGNQQYYSKFEMSYVITDDGKVDMNRLCINRYRNKK